MSYSHLIDPATGKIADQFIGQGGGVQLNKGELITALANQTEVALATGANGTFLSATNDPLNIYGLNWVGIPGVTPLAQGELLSADLAGNATIVTAPVFPGQANYVMTAVAGGAGSPNMLWQPVTGAGGIIDTIAPLVDVAGAGTNTISIGFQGGGAGFAGQIPYGTGVANTGALTNIPASNTQILGVNAGVPTWVDAGGSGIVTATLPLIESAGVGGASNVAINFTAGPVGQIPYGTGVAKTGALTDTPTSGTQILGVSGGVPAWVDAGGSGIVTATAPLIESAGVGGASNIAINFTAGQFGEIPYGNGTASTGTLLLPPVDPGAIGKVLTYAGTPSILEWQTPATPVGGDIITLHSNLASTTVPKPTDKDEQLILVAQEIGASWDLIPSTLPDPFLKAYNPELRFKTSGGQPFICIEQLGGGGRREVALYTEGLSPNYLIGTFVFGDSLAPYQGNALVACACNGIDAYGVNHFAGTQYDDTVIIGGKFNACRITGGTYFAMYNVSLLYLDTTAVPTPKWVVGWVGPTPFPTPTNGWVGLTNGSDVNNPNVGVYSITSFPAGALSGLPAGGAGETDLPAVGFIMTGQFDTLEGEGVGYASIPGFVNMCVFFCATAQPMSQPQTLLNGFGVAGAVVIPGQPVQGIITGLLFNSTYTYFWLIGQIFSIVKQNGSSLYQNVPPNLTGFLLFYPVGLTAGDSAWQQLASIQPAFGTNGGYCIKPSTALADTIIVTGEQSFVKDITVPTAGNASYTTLGSAPATPIAVGFPNGLYGYLNSIATNITITTPLGNVTGDFMVFNTIANSGPQYVGYLATATGAVVQALNPIPCGPNSVALGTEPPSYGINELITVGKLTIGGDSGEYEYDASLHASIVFVCSAGVKFREPAGTLNLGTATFATPYQSQSYIASNDLAYWVQVGATNPNLAYSV